MKNFGIGLIVVGILVGVISGVVGTANKDLMFSEAGFFCGITLILAGLAAFAFQSVAHLLFGLGLVWAAYGFWILVTAKVWYAGGAGIGVMIMGVTGGRMLCSWWPRRKWRKFSCDECGETTYIGDMLVSTYLIFGDHALLCPKCRTPLSKDDLCS